MDKTPNCSIDIDFSTELVKCAYVNLFENAIELYYPARNHRYIFKLSQRR